MGGGDWGRREEGGGREKGERRKEQYIPQYPRQTASQDASSPQAIPPPPKTPTSSPHRSFFPSFCRPCRPSHPKPPNSISRQEAPPPNAPQSATSFPSFLFDKRVPGRLGWKLRLLVVSRWWGRGQTRAGAGRGQGSDTRPNVGGGRAGCRFLGPTQIPGMRTRVGFFGGGYFGGGKGDGK
jgi:hypothetical protein